jgi:8-oxo-dGTP pyrophosphatase MutT (NUDIX family)
MGRVTGPPRPDKETKPVLSAGGVVFDARGRVLLLRRSDEGTWCFPKGHVESGETPKEAAAREIKEEAGLDVRLGKKVAEIHYTFYAHEEGVNQAKRVVYFLATPTGGDIVLEERFDAHRWVPPARALRMLPYRNDKTVLRAALRARSTGRS